MVEQESYRNISNHITHSSHVVLIYEWQAAASDASASYYSVCFENKHNGLEKGMFLSEN